MSVKKILLIVGTRPEAIKVWPVIEEMKQQGVKFEILWSGQHSDLVKINFNEFGFRVDFQLNSVDRKNTLGVNTGELIQKFSNFLEDKAFSCTVVHGDTLTAMSGAIASFYNQIPVFHLEAGLRTHNIRSPFPEEANRKIISSICKTHYAPTNISKQNLIREGHSEKSILVTGNTIVDSIKLAFDKNMLDNINVEKKILSGFENIDTQNVFSNVVLVTCHRQENFGHGITNLCNVLRDFSNLHKELKIIFPVHPNPKIKLITDRILGDIENIYLIDPLGYFDFLTLLRQSRFCISDSGGIQEEARSLCVPLLLYREMTERPEILDWEYCILSKPFDKNLKSDLEKLFMLTKNRVVSNKIQSSIFGDGNASKRIVSDLKKFSDKG